MLIRSEMFNRAQPGRDGAAIVDAMTPVPFDESAFDIRWEAWRAANRADEAALTRKVRVIGPVVAVLVVLALARLIN